MSLKKNRWQFNYSGKLKQMELNGGTGNLYAELLMLGMQIFKTCNMGMRHTTFSENLRNISAN